MKQLALATLVAMASGACTNLPDIEEDGCGNLVLNLDEDCDGFSNMGENTACADPGEENACHFVCDPDEGIVCPTGWGCSEDGLCTAPSGEFTEHPDAPYRFRASEVAVGDLDGDGFNDIVGNDVSTITARFGASGGGLDSELDLLTRTPTGPLSFAHFDEDELLDVVVPTSGGLFTLLGTEDQELEPVAYAPFEAAQDGDLRILPVEAVNDFDSEVVLLFETGMAFLDSSVILPHALPDAFDVGDIVGDIPRAYLERDHGNPNDSDPTTEFALAFSGAQQVWVYSSTGTQTPMLNTLRVVDKQTVALPGPVRFGAHFADVNGDGWYDLLVSVVGPLSMPGVAVAYNDGAGNLESSARLIDAFRRNQGETWPLAAGDLNGDAIADYVFSDAIAYTILDAPYGDPDNFFPVAFATTAPWVGAVLTDINGDGAIDVGTNIEGIEGVDIFVNTGVGLFNKFHIDTDDPPDLLRTGDFDGDLIYDIAFKENVVGTGGQQPNALSVIFGSAFGAPSDPVSMGTLDIIFDLQPLSSVQGFEGLDLITDLIVLSSALDGSSQAVAVMQGSSSRRMLSPFTLEPDAADSDLPDIPIAVVVGHFSVEGDEIPDIVAIAQPTLDFFNEDISPIERRARLWRVPGQNGDGSLDASGTAYVAMPDYEEFDAGCAVFVAGNLDDDSDPTDRDELIGIDNGTECYGAAFSPTGRLFVGRVGDEVDPIDIEILPLPATYSVVRSMMLHDLDGDGDLDLLAAFSGEFQTAADAPDQPVTGAAAVVFWNDGGSLGVDDATVLPLPSPQLHDVDVIELTGDTIPELAILGSGGVYGAVLDMDTKQYGTPTLIFRTMSDRQMAVGDLDADGLDDIAVTLGTDVMIGVQSPAEPLGSRDQAESPADQGGNQ